MTKKERRGAIIQMARDEYAGSDGEILFDCAGVKVSEGNGNGAYVSAWVWVDFGGTDLDKEVVEVESEGGEV